MYVDNFLVRPLFTQGCSFVYPKNCYLYGEINMNICIIEKDEK